MGEVRPEGQLYSKSNQQKFDDQWWDTCGPGQVIPKYGANGEVIGYTTKDLEAGWSQTNFQRLQWQAEAQHAEQMAALSGLVGAIAAINRGEAFDQAKLLVGIQEAARKGALEGSAHGTKLAIDSIDTTVNLKMVEQPANGPALEGTVEG